MLENWLVDFWILLHSHLGGSNDGETLSEPLFDLDDGQVAERPCSGTGNDDSLGSVLNSSTDQLVVKALRPVEDVDHGEFGDVADIKSFLEGRLSGRVVKERLVVQEPSDESLFGSFEGVDKVGVGLLGVKSSTDSVVEGEHGSAVLGIRKTGQGDGFEEVGGSVSGDGGRGPHGSDKDDGLATVDSAVDCE